jgi:hypothetical protein
MTQGNKRLKGESFKKYRTRLKDEAQKVKKYLKGRYIWLSTDLYSGPKWDPSSHMIQVGEGTYRRSMGATGTPR